MSVELLTNNAASTLNGAILSGASTLTVASATGFPSKGNFRILIDLEILLVTATAGTVFTVTRGQEGTTPAGHADTAAVTHVITAAGLARLIRDPFGFLFPQDFGAKADGTTDDSTAIQNCLNAAAGKTVFFPAGTYAIGSGLSLAFNYTKIMASGQMILKKLVNGFDMLACTADYCEIVGVEADNNSKTGSGIGIFGTRCKVRDCYSHDAGANSHGFFIEGTAAKGDHNEILNCRSENNGAIGISQHAATDNLVMGCRTLGNGWEGITIDNGSYRCRVIGNHVENNCLSGGAGNISADQCDNSVISGNQIYNAPAVKPGIMLNNQASNSNFVVISGNDIKDNQGGGIKFNDSFSNFSSHCAITGNVIQSASGSTPLYLGINSNHNVITGNVFNGLGVTNFGTSNTLANND